MISNKNINKKERVGYIYQDWHPHTEIHIIYLKISHPFLFNYNLKIMTLKTLIIILKSKACKIFK
jgi:hypothetical protein